MTISKNQIKETIVSVVQDGYGLEIDSTLGHDGMSLKELGLDSLDTVEMIMIIEDEFRIQITDEYLSTEPTLAELIDHIYDQL